MKSINNQIILALFAVLFCGLGQSVYAQSTSISEADRIQKKEAANQKQERATSRTEADLKAAEERKAQAVKVKATRKPVSRSDRSASKAETAQPSSKGSTAERDARTKKLQDERRAQKAAYLQSKVATEKSTTERELERKSSTRKTPNQ